MKKAETASPEASQATWRTLGLYENESPPPINQDDLRKACAAAQLHPGAPAKLNAPTIVDVDGKPVCSECGMQQTSSAGIHLSRCSMYRADRGLLADLSDTIDRLPFRLAELREVENEKEPKTMATDITYGCKNCRSYHIQRSDYVDGRKPCPLCWSNDLEGIPPGAYDESRRWETLNTIRGVVLNYDVGDGSVRKHEMDRLRAELGTLRYQQRAAVLADSCGELTDENTKLSAENGRLRRKLEDAERKLAGKERRR